MRKAVSSRAPAIATAFLLISGANAIAQDRPQTDAGSAKMTKSPDAVFAIKAAQGGMAEVQLGQLAAQKATAPDVKSFAQMMVDDHTKANDNLKGVAAQENMTLPASMNAKDQALYVKLRNEAGTKFDRDYVRAMVKDHQEDVREFTKESNSGTDLQIKNFATQTLPVLQAHLQKIRSIESGMGK